MHRTRGHGADPAPNDSSSSLASAGLPGAEFIRAGLADLAHGHESLPALLVSIGAPRLRLLGVLVRDPISMPEHRLYEMLRAADPDTAHSRYNSLIRRLVSFERAAASSG